MSANQVLSALQKEATRQKILEAGFNIFAENTIEKVTMNDVADAAGIGVATVYRYFGTKTVLTAAISGWMWGRYVDGVERLAEQRSATAIEQYEYFLDSFLDLYRNHKDLLRYNQFFNVYLMNEKAAPETMTSYNDVMKLIARRFHMIYEDARRDGTLRTDVPEEEMLFTSLHLMLAAVTRYAVGLVYEGGQDPEKELILLKSMLLREYTA